jgi:AcrR family transcriptional regulator
MTHFLTSVKNQIGSSEGERKGKFFIMAKKIKPRGRDEVVTALIQAAAELFSEKGVEAVSLRQIAARADVNHGLIHRHFGSKEALRRQTQESLAAGIREEIGDPDNFFNTVLRSSKAMRRNDKFWRVMARTFLDGKYQGEIQNNFPFVRKLVELVRREQKKKSITSKIDPRNIVASILAYGLGMLVFERYILPAVGLDAAPHEKVVEKLDRELFSLFKK